MEVADSVDCNNTKPHTHTHGVRSRVGMSSHSLIGLWLRLISPESTVRLTLVYFVLGYLRAFVIRLAQTCAVLKCQLAHVPPAGVQRLETHTRTGSWMRWLHRAPGFQ